MDTRWESIPGDGDTAIVQIDGDRIELSPASVQRYFGGSRYVASAEDQAKIKNGIALAKQLVRPVGMLAIHAIEGIAKPERLQLQGGRTVATPPQSMPAGATAIAVCLITLGEDLEQYCRQLAGGGEIYASVLLDAAGTALLDSCEAICCEILNRESDRRGLYLGRRHSPGLADYPMSGQGDLFSLMDAARIGVSLNSAFIMSPVKSLTHLTYLTTIRNEARPEYKCQRCDHKNCQYRTTSQA